MTVLLDILRDMPTRSRRRAASGRDLAGWIERHDIPDDAAPHAIAAIVIWTRLHGLVSLEIDGNYASVGLDPAPLYASEVARAVDQYRP